MWRRMKQYIGLTLHLAPDEEPLASLNEKSKTSDGISKNCVKAIWSTILPMLLIWMNMIFKGGVNAYPKNWLNLVMAIPKKGRLALPKFVRYISIMGNLRKTVPNNNEQTAV